MRCFGRREAEALGAKERFGAVANIDNRTTYQAVAPLPRGRGKAPGSLQDVCRRNGLAAVSAAILVDEAWSAHVGGPALLRRTWPVETSLYYAT